MGAAHRGLYYAFGGGLGHGVRTVALARHCARRLPGEHLLLLNTPFALALSQLVAAEPGLRVQALAPEAGPREAGRFLGDILRTFRPSLLVVDTFPRGLGGELAALVPECRGCLRVLVSRSLPAAYVTGYGLADFVRRQYDLVLAPGEPSPFEGMLDLCHTEAFLIRDYDELPSVEIAAALVGSSSDRPVVLLVGSGTEEECGETARQGTELQAGWREDGPPLRLALPPGFERLGLPGGPPLVAHMPLLECLPAVRLVVGGAGYNLVQEAAALSVPGIFQPRRRRYDDQDGRVSARNCRSPGGDLRAAILRALEQPRGALKSYSNGASQAADLIARRVPGSTGVRDQRRPVG